MNLLKANWWLAILVFIVTLFGYYWLAFEVERTDHVALFSIFAGVILLSFVLYRWLPRKDWWILFSVGLVFRLVFLVATPALSDDYFRFTWDGELTSDGYSTFAFLPENFKQNIAPEHHQKYQDLLSAKSDRFPDGMNSRSYYSIYPAVNQWIFYSATWGNSPNNGNLIILRIWLLIAEVISFFLLRALLKRKSRESWITVYWWHPFVILELVGNLHFEGIAIVFILATVYYAHKNQWFQTALMAAFGIMTKLTPIFLLGALFRQFNWRKWMLTCLSAIVLAGLFFWTIVNMNTLSNFGNSADLFFNLFAFNSATYYGMVEIALEYEWEKARETVAAMLPWFSIVLGIMVVFLHKRSMEWTLMLLFTIYFFFSPIVHPWYITVLIPLALLTQTIYPLVWSVLIFGTYIAYGDEIIVPERLIYTEYLIVFTLLIFEILPGRNVVKNGVSKLIYSSWS